MVVLKYSEFIIKPGNGLTIYDSKMTERLYTQEHLWDALTHEMANGSGSTAYPDWHLDILKKRKEKIINGKAEFTSLSELKKRRNL